MRLDGRMCVCAARDDAVCPGLQTHKKQCQDGHGNLKTLGTFFFAALLAAPPLGRRLPAQVPHPGQNQQVGNCPNCCEHQHGDPDGVLVKPADGRSDAPGQGKGRQSDSQPQSANGEHRRADTLHQSQNKA